MPNLWVVLLYALIFVWALFLVWRFKAQAWYWHVLSLVLALVLGLIPPPAGMQGLVYDVLFGCAFLFLIVWGIAGMVLYRTHHPKHRHA